MYQNLEFSDEVYEEEDGLVGKDPIPPTISYDKDPPMVVGSTYANMKKKISWHYLSMQLNTSLNLILKRVILGE
jgi:hypothetical protein